ncbi:EAL domain-containing protein [Oceanicola sp. S124]|uniref:EAL domain-containing protein n=1 Tax=Oceanicola sp. S124 TaxID=1042378 RepID=UPI0003191716|nr:EAL domain-containing protein [Oceanicola sp. S124]
MSRGKVKWQDVPSGMEDPLSWAVSTRDAEAMSMVARALDAEEVALAYQPVMRAGSGQVAFYEGLIRIYDPAGRIIPARDFISSIEATELGRRVDCAALDMGLQTLADHPELRIAINMSARSIGYPHWMQVLTRGLDRDPTAGERLILEITEHSAMVLPELVTCFMRDIQARGVAFALDDFGSGHTSFRHLRDFFFDILKLDALFTRGIAGNPDNQVLTQALLVIAEQLDMFTVAEAVESGEDAAWLEANGIEYLQGYYYGAPTIHPPLHRDES